ncbi:MAG: M15 family metallopeptidase, partial [Gemmataceae bacterium]|nr:M15 family metallopeptidase [Gemmataceae bacterium]
MYGFATELAFLPDEKLGVVVAISCDWANPVAHRIAEFALEALLAARDGQPLPSFITTKSVSDEWRRRIHGTWIDEKTQRVFTVQDLGGRVWLWPHRGGTRVELREDGPDLVSDDRLGFGLRIRWVDQRPQVNGQPWIRRDVDAPPPPPPDRWRGLIGEYGEDHNVLYILEWDGRLVALIEWFFIYPLKEISENVFQFPDFGLYHDEKLIFERDASGRATKVTAASVPFSRRVIQGEDGQTFRIRPVRQLDGLLKEALAATPPRNSDDLLPADLVDVTTVEPGIKLDIRYATENNFLSTPLYSSARAFLQRPAAEALGRVHRSLAEKGYGLLVHDAYRPWYVTYMFREATPAKWHHFVADPKQGSRHNRGCAVDLTLYDLKTGQPVEMVGGYDEFSDRSYPDYFGGTSRQRWHRDLLRRAMEAEGFSVYEAEWWHFDYKDWRRYPILNKRFEELP